MLSYYNDKEFNCFELKKCHNDAHSEKKHFHAELSIAYIEEGATNVTFEGVTHHFNKNNLVIIPPYLAHQCFPENINDFKFSMLYINRDWIYKNFEIDLQNNELFIYKVTHKESLEIKNIFSKLEEEIHRVEKELILIKFIEKYLILKNPLYQKIKLNTINNNKIKLIKEYIDVQFNENLSLDKLSEISGISKYHLTRTFTEIYHLSPLNYQKSLKFNYSKELLKKNQSEISDIALNLGYFDQSHFSNDFKKFSGISPKNYKKSNK